MVVDSSESDDSSQNGIGAYIRDRLGNFRTYLKVTRATNIIRRYFAMNAFDGAMTSLGVVIGAYLSGIHDPRAIIGVILVGGIAMMVSGFSGTYMTESAERSHSLNELQEAMLIDLNDSIYGRASRFVSIYAAIVDGSAPFLSSIPSVIPFFFATMGLLSLGTAFIFSVTASLVSLFLLGVYLGRISGGNLLSFGFKMVVAGVAVAVLALLLNGH
jgi:predicted membrane protein (TIGR00267 family)